MSYDAPASINNITFFDENRPLLQQLTAKRLNLMMRAIVARTPQPGTNTRLHRFPGGFTYDGIQGNTNAFIAPTGYPFKMYDISVSGHARLRVNSGDGYAGSIGNSIANISGVQINYTPPVTIPPTTPNPPFLSVSDGDMIYIKINLDSTGTTIAPGPSSVTILNGPTVPPSDTAMPPTFTYFLIGSVSVNSSKPVPVITISQAITGSQWFIMCGGTPLFGSTSSTF